MVIVNFPTPAARQEPMPDELAPDAETPAEAPDPAPVQDPTRDPVQMQMRELLLKTHLRRALRGRRKARSPASVIARSLAPQNGPVGVGATRIDPFELLGEWLGLALQAAPQARQGTAQPAPGPTADPAPRHPAPAVGRGASDAFWAAWMTHEGLMKGLAMRLMQGNEADAEDALGAAMLRAERAFDPQAIHNPAAWFSRLVRNACIDHYRYRSRAPTLGDGMETTLEEDLPASPAALAPPRSGEDELLSNEGLRETLCAILELPEELMEPLLLRCLAERSYDEIARDMGLSNAAVRKRVQLARQHLQSIL